jgi:cytochrome b561
MIKTQLPSQYSPAQKWFHWSMALLILSMLVIGVTMKNLNDGALKDWLYELHKSIGITLLALALVRAAVRWRRGAPPLEPGVPAWQRAAARASHYALYALIMLTPIAGWTATSSCCPPVNLFWTVPLTLPVPRDEAFSETVFRIHFSLAFALAAVIVLHVAGALQHHFIRKDRTLLRMLPGDPGP